MKKRFNKRSALLILSLLIIGMSLACFVWMRKEQRQDALDRQLIAALMLDDTRQARVLVEAGADPNTRVGPAPSLPLQLQQLLHLAPPQASTSNTAFLIACGSGVDFSQGADIAPVYDFHHPDPQLTQVMLLHGAKVNVRGRSGLTALHWSVLSALYTSPLAPVQYNKTKEIIQQLLTSEADPDKEDKAFPGFFGTTPLKSALNTGFVRLPPRPDLVALLRKYRKHP